MITVSHTLLTDTAKVHLMVDSLRKTLEVLNPLGVELVLGMMYRECDVICSNVACSPRNEIEKALHKVLGEEAGAVVIREWDREMKLMSQSRYA